MWCTKCKERMSSCDRDIWDLTLKLRHLRPHALCSFRAKQNTDLQSSMICNDLICNNSITNKFSNVFSLLIILIFFTEKTRLYEYFSLLTCYSRYEIRTWQQKQDKKFLVWQTTQLARNLNFEIKLTKSCILLF